MKNCVDVARHFEEIEDIASIINECIWYYRYEFTLLNVNIKGNIVDLRFLRINEKR